MWHLHFSTRGSDNTNIINGLNTIRGYQSCVWNISYDIWKKIYLWEYELVSLFPTKPVPSCEYWKAFMKAHHLLISRSSKNMPIYMSRRCWRFYTLCSRQNGRHFADDTFKRFFINENVGILIKISLKFVPQGPTSNIPSLVQIMAWRRQAIIWTIDGLVTDAYMRRSASNELN